VRKSSWIAVVFGVVLVSHTAKAAPSRDCTLIADVKTGTMLVQSGVCDQRISPASSFKLVLALMGFDSGVLLSPDVPVWHFRQGYPDWMPVWRNPTSPRGWLRDSVLWYSMVLTGKMGHATLQRYVDAFSYGNRDLTAPVQKGAILPVAYWVNSSLAISPLEQMAFLQKMLSGKLPVSADAVRKTMATAPSFRDADGDTVFGKTGSGLGTGRNLTRDPAVQFGWFVGWADLRGRRVVFVRLVREDDRREGFAGPRARDGLLADLPRLVAR